MEQLKTDIASGDMALDARLQDMNIEPEEYKAYGYPISLRRRQDLLTPLQTLAQPTTRKQAIRRMGTSDPRGSTGEMEEVAGDA